MNSVRFDTSHQHINILPIYILIYLFSIYRTTTMYAYFIMHKSSLHKFYPHTNKFITFQIFCITKRNNRSLDDDNFFCITKKIINSLKDEIVFALKMNYPLIRG